MEAAHRVSGGSTMKRRIVAIVAVILAALAAVIVAPSIVRYRRHEARAERYAALEQIGAALIAYSHEAKGERFPPKAIEPGAFHPDLDVFGSFLAQRPDGERLAEVLTATQPTPLCYLGHAVVDEEAALYLLNQYETGDAAWVRAHDLNAFREAYLSHIFLLRDGIERFFITDIGSPAASEKAMSVVPVLWELPRPNKRGEGLVLYLDGHVETLRYPSIFPMTERFVFEARRMMGLRDPEPPEPGGSFFLSQSPVARQAQTILTTTIGWDIPPACWEITHCDTRPSVHVDGYTGYQIAYRRTRPPSQFPRTLEAFEVILFPTSSNMQTSIKTLLPWQDHGGVPGNMGRAMGFQWFSNASEILQDRLRHACKLNDGEDRYALYAEAGRQRGIYPQRYMAHQESLSDLNDILASPERFSDYRAAIAETRKRENRPIPVSIGDAERILWGWLRPYDNYPGNPEDLALEAATRIAESSDTEAAALVALSLALTHLQPMMPLNIKACQSTGRDILRKLPSEPCVDMISHLAANLGDGVERAMCRELLLELWGVEVE